MKICWLVAFALGLGMVLLLTGSSAAQAPMPGSTIVVGIYAEPDSLYIYGGDSFANTYVNEAFMDGPIDSRSWDHFPVILEKLPGVEDGDAVTRTVTVDAGDRYVSGDEILIATEVMFLPQMVITFTLKPGIYWSDGHPLTAADSAFSFEVDGSPDSPTSKYTCDRTSGYDAPDDVTTVWTGLPGYLDPQYYTHFWTPLPEHVLGGMAPLEILESDYGRKPLGWGPFAVDEWVPGQYISLVRNPFYWRPGLPKVDRLVFRFPSDPAQALKALLSGEIHVLTQYTLDYNQNPLYANLAAQGALRVQFSGSDYHEHLDFGIQPSDGRIPFFADPTVRQAVASGTNRQAIVDALLYGQGEINNSYLPPEHFYYPPPGVVSEYPYNPGTARALLESVGWKDDDGDGVREAHAVVYQVPTWDWDNGTYGPTQTVSIPNGTPFVASLSTTDRPLRRQEGAMFQQDMAAIGISITLEFVSPGVLFGDGPDGLLAGRKFDIIMYSSGAETEPWCDFYLGSEISAAPNGWYGLNTTGFVDPAYDMACNAARAELLRDVRAGYFYTTQRIVSEKLPELPLYWESAEALSNPNLQGFQLSSPGWPELWNVEEWELSSQGHADPVGGGGVESNDGRTIVELAPGAISDTVKLIFTPWVVSAGGSLAAIGHAFDLTAVYSDTARPASLLAGRTYSVTVHYSDAELTAPIGEATLALYAWDGGQWVKETSSTIDMATNVVSATPDHFSLWAVLAETHRLYLPVVLRTH